MYAYVAMCTILYLDELYKHDPMRNINSMIFQRIVEFGAAPSLILNCKHGVSWRRREYVFRMGRLWNVSTQIDMGHEWVKYTEWGYAAKEKVGKSPVKCAISVKLMVCYGTTNFTHKCLHKKLLNYAYSITIHWYRRPWSYCESVVNQAFVLESRFSKENSWW